MIRLHKIIIFFLPADSSGLVHFDEVSSHNRKAHVAKTWCDLWSIASVPQETEFYQQPQEVPTLCSAFLWGPSPGQLSVQPVKDIQGEAPAKPDSVSSQQLWDNKCGLFPADAFVLICYASVDT